MKKSVTLRVTGLALIADIIELAQDGDVIVIDPGVYTLQEPITIQKPLKVRGKRGER